MKGERRRRDGSTRDIQSDKLCEIFNRGKGSTSRSSSKYLNRVPEVAFPERPHRLGDEQPRTLQIPEGDDLIGRVHAVVRHGYESSNGSYPPNWRAQASVPLYRGMPCLWKGILFRLPDHDLPYPLDKFASISITGPLPRDMSTTLEASTKGARAWLTSHAIAHHGLILKAETDDPRTRFPPEP